MAGLSSTKSSDPTAAQVALQIPEILLNIFSNCRSDLTTLALVTRAFTPPATSLLYEKLSLDWRSTQVRFLLRSFSTNPQLFHLVRSLEVVCIDGEAGQGVSDGPDLDIITFFGRLPNLHHLTLNNLDSTVDSDSASISRQKDLEQVMRGLVSLKVQDMVTFFWERACGSATSLETLDLSGPFYPDFHDEIPPLRHLVIDGFDRRADEVLAGFKETLETLHLEYTMQVPPWDFLQSPTIFSQISYLHLSYAPLSVVEPIQSFVQSMPMLRYLGWDDWDEDEPLLALLIPYLPTSIRLIKARCWTATLPSILEAAARHLPRLQYSLHIYEVEQSSEDFTERTSKALEQGVKLEFFDGSLFYKLPTLVDLWHDERARRSSCNGKGLASSPPVPPFK